MGLAWPIADACLALVSGATATGAAECGPSAAFGTAALPLLAEEDVAATEICCDADESDDCNNGNGVRVGGAFVAAADVSDDVEADEDVIEVVVVELNEVDEVETAAAAGAHVVAGSEEESGGSGGDMADKGFIVGCVFNANEEPSRPLIAVRSLEVLSALGALSLRVEMVL